MAAANSSPITSEKLFNLITSFGIDKKFMNSTCVTMGSDKYICVLESTPGNIVLIDVTDVWAKRTRINIKAESALLNPNSKCLVVKDKVDSQDRLQILNIDECKILKSIGCTGQVIFWKWITPDMLALVTRTRIWRWSIEGEGTPETMITGTFNCQILDCHFDPSQRWVALITRPEGSAEAVEGTLQLFHAGHCEHHRKAFAALFTQYEVPRNENPSLLLLAFASASKVEVEKLPSQQPQQGKLCFLKKEADILFPSNSVGDYPIAVQISRKYSLIYVITRLGLVFLYDLETATPVFEGIISKEPLILTTEASSVGGFYTVDEHGQVFLVSINEQTIMTYVANQLKNLELGLKVAKRGPLSLPFQDIPNAMKSCQKLPETPATQDIKVLQDEFGFKYVCKLSEKLQTTPISSRWVGDRLTEEYQTYNQDVISHLGTLHSCYNIDRGVLNSDLVGIDRDGRARILKVYDPNSGWSPRCRLYKDHLITNLIPEMLGTPEMLDAEGAKIELQHFYKMLKKNTDWHNLYYHPINQASLERFFFPGDAISHIMYHKDTVRSSSTWESVFRSKMPNQVFNIKSLIENSNVSCSDVFKTVYKNHMGVSHGNDILGVCKFMRNVTVHAIDYAFVDPCTLEKDLTTVFPGALTLIYEVLVALRLDLRKLSRRSAISQLDKDKLFRALEE